MPLLPKNGHRGKQWRNHRQVIDGIRVPRPGRRGRPRKRTDHLIADKGYTNPTHRRVLRRRGMPHTIPERRDQRWRPHDRAGRCTSTPRYTGAGTWQNGA